MSVNPGKRIEIDGNNVQIYVSCRYPASESGSTADSVWPVASNFSSLRTIFPNIISCYLNYPDGNGTQVGTQRNLVFSGGTNVTIEELTAFDNTRRTFEYIQLQGLPVEDYKADVSLTGDNECTLNWVITYTDTADKKEDFWLLVRSNSPEQSCFSLERT